MAIRTRPPSVSCHGVDTRLSLGRLLAVARFWIEKTQKPQITADIIRINTKEPLFIKQQSENLRLFEEIYQFPLALLIFTFNLTIMDNFRMMKKRDGFLNGHLLIAMPGMEDERFSRSVIYICAHSDEGAMGLVLNKPQDMVFPDLLIQLGIINSAQASHLPELAKTIPVRDGGPVERARGFVLHSDDYACQATIPVTNEICLTSTTDVLKAMSMGKGPQKAIVTLGYAGWGAGQLESEISANGWLTSPVDAGFLFADGLDNKYQQSLLRIGVDPAFLVAQAGHA